MYPLSYPKNTTSTKQGNFSSLNLFSRQLWLHMYYLLKFGKARKTKSQGWIFFWKNFSLTSHKYQGMYVCMLVEIIHSFQDFLCLWHDAHLSCLSLTMHFFPSASYRWDIITKPRGLLNSFSNSKITSTII